MEAGADKAPGSIAPPAPQAGNTAGSTTATPPPRTTQTV
jgi:hypothetical protein